MRGCQTIPKRGCIMQERNAWLRLILIGVVLTAMAFMTAPGFALDPGLYIADWGVGMGPRGGYVWRLDSAGNVTQFFPREREPLLNGPVQLK